MSLKLITAPTTEPISLTEAKSQCHVDGTDEDTLLTMFIVAARRAAEQRTGRALINQTWELALDEWGDEIALAYPPVSSITSVKYLDTAGVEQTLSNTVYALDTYGMEHVLRLAYNQSWPSVRETENTIKIRYVAGYGTASDVPADIKAWMLLAIGTMYANRESASQGASHEVAGGFWQQLLDPYLTY